LSFEQCEKSEKGNTTIGLFGTCGKSTWRNEFIDLYKKKDIQWFNPNVRDWNSECSDIEANHLIEDDIILFPILDSELGIASLSEAPFSVLRAITERGSKFTVIMIEDIDPSVVDIFGEVAYKASKSARTIVKAHLKKISHKHIFVVDNLEDMLEISVSLEQACNHIKQAKSVENNS